MPGFSSHARRMRVTCILYLLFVLGGCQYYTTLSNGVLFPLIGYGTAGGVKEKHIEFALRSGYKAIDSAQATEWYSEVDVGLALKAIDRTGVFVTTKLHPRYFGSGNTTRMIHESFIKLGTSYIDGFLIHTSHCNPNLCDTEPAGTWKDSWRVMESYYERGKIKSIGVSNFVLDELKELLQFAQIQPHFVQMWNDPYHQDKEMVAFCQQHKIVYQAFSSFGTQWMKILGSNPLLSDSVLVNIAQQQGRSVAQVILKYQLQQNIAVIPRSTNEVRILENTQLDFRLTEDQMQAIANLDGFYNKWVKLTLHNHLSTDVIIKWDGEETARVMAGEGLVLNTYDGHVLTLVSQDKVLRKAHIHSSAGTEQQISITEEFLPEAAKPITVNIWNKSEFDISLFWKKQHIDTIKPHSTMRLNSFMGHKLHFYADDDFVHSVEIGEKSRDIAITNEDVMSEAVLTPSLSYYASVYYDEGKEKYIRRDVVKSEL